MNNDLYQDQIIHWSKKTHLETLEGAQCVHAVSNPLCGDKLTVSLQIDGEKIIAMAYKVRGCLLCKASSAILAQWVNGRTLDQLIDLYHELKRALKSVDKSNEPFPRAFDLFQPVQAHKSRHNCVLLPFDAVIQAMETQRDG